MDQGFEAVMKTITDSKAETAARKFMQKKGLVEMSYKEVCNDIIQAARRVDGRFMSTAKDNAVIAETRADELYIWARGFIPSGISSPVGLDRQGKIDMMPYIMAMAFAVRVRVDARKVRTSSIEDDSDRMSFSERTRGIIDELISVIRSAIVALVSNTSLLEIALDYHEQLAAYVNLIAGLEASEQSMSAPEERPDNDILWDDGLSEIR